jgi:hypothetical protein
MTAINKSLFFDNLSSFWEYSFRECHAYRRASRDNSELNWSGGLTWEQAKSLALSGWSEGAAEAERMRAQVFLKVADKVLRPKQVSAMAGYCVDVGSYLANQPECFIGREFDERNYPGRVYRVVASISFSAAISPEVIIQRGAMICAIVDAIEYAGHRVEVICNDANSANKGDSFRRGEHKGAGWFEVSVVLKKASQPLDMSDLAFCLAHPAMLRRIMFSVAEIIGWSDFVNHYGYPAEATDKGDIYIREVFSEAVSDEKAVEWTLKELERLGINLETA